MRDYPCNRSIFSLHKTFSMMICSCSLGKFKSWSISYCDIVIFPRHVMQAYQQHLRLHPSSKSADTSIISDSTKVGKQVTTNKQVKHIVTNIHHLERRRRSENSKFEGRRYVIYDRKPEEKKKKKKVYIYIIVL